MITQLLSTQDKYTHVRELGCGAMGRVTHVTDGETNYAMKILSVHDSSDEQVKWFIREAELLQSLNCEGIPKVREWFYDSARGYCMVMEFIDGETIEAIRLRRKISEREVVEWTQQVLLILEHLHGVSKIVHRDLKPSNIMLDARGKIWLIDLGVANKMGMGKGTAIGTLGYAAPEQIFGNADARSDLYTLGMVMRTLLIGVEPGEFPTKPFEGTKNRKLCAVVTRATQFDASSRYESARDMSKALSDIAIVQNPIVPATGSGGYNRIDDLRLDLQNLSRILLITMSLTLLAPLAVDFCCMIFDPLVIFAQVFIQECGPSLLWVFAFAAVKYLKDY
ncbi:MAG: serine/threonine protein kinase [Parcubacteria group bacterium]|nr:serine/threonine protein kinase [Parcubacteria group bacterium]